MALTSDYVFISGDGLAPPSGFTRVFFDARVADHTIDWHIKNLIAITLEGTGVSWDGQQAVEFDTGAISAGNVSVGYLCYFNGGLYEIITVDEAGDRVKLNNSFLGTFAAWIGGNSPDIEEILEDYCDTYIYNCLVIDVCQTDAIYNQLKSSSGVANDNVWTIVINIPLVDGEYKFHNWWKYPQPRRISGTGAQNKVLEIQSGHENFVMVNYYMGPGIGEDKPIVGIESLVAQRNIIFHRCRFSPQYGGITNEGLYAIYQINSTAECILTISKCVFEHTFSRPNVFVWMTNCIICSYKNNYRYNANALGSSGTLISIDDTFYGLTEYNPSLTISGGSNTFIINSTSMNASGATANNNQDAESIVFIDCISTDATLMNLSGGATGSAIGIETICKTEGSLVNPTNLLCIEDTSIDLDIQGNLLTHRMTSQQDGQYPITRFGKSRGKF